MENYSKGKNIEEELKKENLKIPGLPENFIWMQVKGGSKMRNLLQLALEEYQNGQEVLWSGSGPALGKTISCAEIMKKRFNPIYQFNKICFRRCQEYWDPKLEGLDPLVVNRDIPMIHILLSHQPINQGLPGYQAFGVENQQLPSKERHYDGNRKFSKKSTHKRPTSQDTQQMENYGLKFNRKKNNRKPK